MPIHTIRIGEDEHAFSVAGGDLAGVLEPGTPEIAAPASAILRECLETPIRAPRLRDLARGRRSAVILIPGIDRVAGTREYVTALVDELHRAGLHDRNITVVLAPGTHPHSLDADLPRLLGPELAGRVRGLGHDCHAKDRLRDLGTTRFGTPVLLNRDVLDADLKILTGRVIPHYFAGFSGGRKALLPGVAGFASILANHRLTLAADSGIHPAVAPGSLQGNPVHLDMLEASLMAKPDFCLSTLLDGDGRLVGAVAGDVLASHEEACRLARQMFHRTIPAPVDVLITSAGGHPYDINFMQSLKAVFNVEAIVRPGGAVLWLAACPAGIHPGFLEWANVIGDEELDHAVRRAYDLTGHNSVMLRRLRRRAEVALCSTLPANVVARLGLRPVASVDEGLAWIRRRFPAGFRYAVVPVANIVSATIEPEQPATGHRPAR
ncbi:MAG TPA: nickel-dependent lactate racemase [Methylomirabilota bacterium]|nr:nickel-dependent lactate racemase [Methylomirabilota bacterium]